MQQFRDVALSPTGRPIQGATVTVTISGGGAAALYTGNGTGLLGSNVLTTDANGEYTFYAANGRYTLTIAAAGYATTMRDEVLIDPARGRYSTFIVAAESARYGLINYRINLGAREVPDNEKDRAFHVEGTMPDRPATDVNRDLIAYSYLLETDHHGPLGGEVRGIKGIVRANGGQANLRSAHLLAEGYNGHTGDLTGVLADVFYSDSVPGDAAVGSKSAAFLGQVGAGMKSVFSARSRFTSGYPATPQTVDYVYRQEEGANAVHARIASFQAHGGGGGSLYRGLASDVDSTVVFNVRASGHTTAPGYCSGVQVSLADDTAFSITPPQSTGVLVVHAAGASTQWAMVAYVATGSPAVASMAVGSGAATTTGALTGTTGTDTKLTVSAHTDGKIYIENRVGAARSISYTFFTAPV